MVLGEASMEAEPRQGGFSLGTPLLGAEEYSGDRLAATATAAASFSVTCINGLNALTGTISCFFYYFCFVLLYFSALAYTTLNT